MSRERVFKALTNLGLARDDIKVYVFLAKEGPHETHSLSEALIMQEQELFSRLETLKKKGMIKAMDEIVPAQFYAVPFEKAVDQLVEDTLKEAQFAEKNKKEVLKYWDSMLKKESGNNDINR